MLYIYRHRIIVTINRRIDMPANKTIKIEVYGGCVTEVTGLPEGYDYEIVDHDHLEAEQDASSK